MADDVERFHGAALVDSRHLRNELVVEVELVCFDNKRHDATSFRLGA